MFIHGMYSSCCKSACMYTCMYIHVHDACTTYCMSLVVWCVGYTWVSVAISVISFPWSHSLVPSFGTGSGHIWLDEVVCRGDEYFIQNCDHDPFGENDCFHTEDVGLRCQREGVRVWDCEVVSVKVWGCEHMGLRYQLFFNAVRVWSWLHYHIVHSHIITPS